MAQIVDTSFLAPSMKELRSDDIISKLIGVTLLKDGDSSNDLIGAGLLTNSKAAITAGLIDKLGR